MSVVINTNYAATLAANNLASSNEALQRSLNRLSSGSKIVTPADDAGGLAVSMKLAAAATRQSAVLNNLGNSTSYLQTQDGALKTAGKLLERISELKTLAGDVTKNSSDIANYNAEFVSLQAQLTAIGGEKFNGISLFGSSTMPVGTTEDGGTTLEIGGINFLGTGRTPAAWSNISGISVGSSFIESTPGMISTGPGYMFFTADGTLTSSQSNVSGPYSMSFDYSNADGPISGEEMTLSMGGASINLTSLVGDADVFSTFEIEYDGTQTTLSIDGGPASVIADISTPGGGAVVFAHSGSDGPAYQSLYNFQLSSPSSGSGNISNVASAGSLTALDVSTVTAAIEELATHRATNGAQQSRIGFAAELLVTNKANLEAATSRIVDVDVATESSQLARYNILVQAGTSMLAQANQSSQIALKLLG